MRQQPTNQREVPMARQKTQTQYKKDKNTNTHTGSRFIHWDLFQDAGSCCCVSPERARPRDISISLRFCPRAVLGPQTSVGTQRYKHNCTQNSQGAHTHTHKHAFDTPPRRDHDYWEYPFVDMVLFNVAWVSVDIAFILVIYYLLVIIGLNFPICRPDYKSNCQLDGQQRH